MLDLQMIDCLGEEEVKGPYPMTTICFLQIHVVQVNWDHQTEIEIALKMFKQKSNMFSPPVSEIKLTRAR